MNTEQPVIGITMGDPCGIGAEIILKALADSDLRHRGRYVVFGFSEQLSYTADRLDVDVEFFRDHHEDIRRYPHQVVVLDYDEFCPPSAMPRGPSKLGGQASMAFCQDAIDAAQRQLVDAIVTAPISKTSWKILEVGQDHEVPRTHGTSGRPLQDEVRGDDVCRPAAEGSAGYHSRGAA